MPVTPAPAKPLPVLRSGGDLLTANPPPQTYATASPHFPHEEVGILVGGHGIGKSTVALGACLSVATGRPWLDHVQVTNVGRAVFITLEDKLPTLVSRVRAWLHPIERRSSLPGWNDPHGRDAVEQAINERFKFLSREEATPLILTETKRGITVPRQNIAEHLARVCEGASLVVLETGARVHSGPETNDAFAALFPQLEMIAQRSGAHVLLGHHVGKQAARDGATDSYAGRGGGSLADAARSILTVARLKEDALSTVTITHAKCTTARPADPIDVQPFETPHGIFFKTIPADARVNADAEVLFRFIHEQGPEGILSSKFNRGAAPAGLPRKRAKTALNVLLAAGRVREVRSARGNKVTYVAAEFATPPDNVVRLVIPDVQQQQQQ